MSKFQYRFWLGSTAIADLFFASWTSEGNFLRGLLALVFALPLWLGVCYAASIPISRIFDSVAKLQLWDSLKMDGVKAYAELALALAIGGLFAALLVKSINDGSVSMITLSGALSVVGLYSIKDALSDVVRYHRVNYQMRFPKVSRHQDQHG